LTLPKGALPCIDINQLAFLATVDRRGTCSIVENTVLAVSLNHVLLTRYWKNKASMVARRLM